MKYQENNFYNRENEEIVIRPVYAPIMLRFKQSHYGYENMFLFPKDIARLNVEGLENNNNFYCWKQEENSYSIYNGYKFSIVRNKNIFYLFETGLHQDFIDDCKLVKMVEIETENAIKEFTELLKSVKNYTKEEIVEIILLSKNLVKLPREMKRLENINNYNKEMKEIVLKLI